MRRTFPILLGWLAMVLLLGLPRAAGAAEVSGTWKLTVTTKDSTADVTLKLKQDGEKVSGTVTGQEGKEYPIQDGMLKGNDLQFTVMAEHNGAPARYTIKAVLNGDSLKGTAEVEGETHNFTGTRQAAAPADSLTGAWNLTVEAPNQTYHPTVTFAQDGEKLAGTFKTEEGTETKVMEGSLKGDAISFAVDLTLNGRDLHLVFTGTRNAKGLKGDLHVGDMTVTWSGERAPAPAAK
jgi:hypothetical protein